MPRSAGRVRLEEPEGVVHVPAGKASTCRTVLGAAAGPARGILPELPGWPMAGDRVLLIGLDRRIRHAGKVVVGLVVHAHVVEAVAPVLAFVAATLGSAVGRRLAAARPVAIGRGAPAWRILVGLHPDAVEDGRVELHAWSMGFTGRGDKGGDAGVRVEE